MSYLQALTFTTPLALWALLLLPVIWWLLRFTPPRPETVRFPPLRLLLDLVNREEQPDKTPWWLMLLRLAIAALVILGVSHPLYAPGHIDAANRDPLLLVVDDTWAAAGDWDKRLVVLNEILEDAGRNDAVVTLATAAPRLRPVDLEPAAADKVQQRLAALQPQALDADRAGLLARLRNQFGSSAALRVIWMSDGLDDGAATSFAAGLTTLANGGATVEAILPEASRLPLALAAPGFDGGRISVTALRADTAQALGARAIARAGNGRALSEANLIFAAGQGKASSVMDLPVELRNEIARIDIENQRNAAAVYLMDDRWRRKTIALQSGAASENAQPLLSPLYYVSRALEPYGDMSEPADPAALKAALDQGLSMLVLADIGVLPAETAAEVRKWVEAGGVLLRFAGPRLAGAQDDLVPVKLREGGRALGSALSWETPQAMQPFPETSPFAGLAVNPDVRVTRQVLAEPDADLPERVWANLADGTPLVTARREGKGTIVLFHVTANADWSNLPLTGLFVDMLRRIVDLAPAAGSGTTATADEANAAAGFAPFRSLDGFGSLTDPPPEIRPIPATRIDEAKASPATPAGLYRRGGQERAVNIARSGDRLTAITALPPGVAIRSLAPQPAKPLAPWLFAAAAVLFLADCLAALLLGGGINRLRARRAAVSLLVFAVLLPMAHVALAQDAKDDFAMQAALQTRLAYVITGDASIDRVSEEGLKGLNLILRDRTSVDPGDPVGINIERDEIVFFPLLYWPVRADATVPSDATLAKIDTYMKNGGTIFFDLRNDGTSVDALTGSTTGPAEALRRMLAKLDIPPLEPVPENHVLTRTFYLMQDFPGRYADGKLWVEQMDAQDSTSGAIDGVSSIIIGSNDYASAWALDASGEPLYAVIPGIDRQRELAFRTGVNIVMYALTGNYKADQVHIPALLERLGQ
ncbi:MAG: DUF4159 domain-containing protein [Hyphomicrobiales bacterium]